MKRTLAILSIILFMGCSDNFKEEYKKSYDESFRKSFRASFIKSCTESAGDTKFKDICTCVADDLVESLSVQDLKDEKKVFDHVEKISRKKCIN
ncbi:MAG: hypothetical protein GY789_15520 [Hyphomicrobiales bacterium]|nr:hypothetical protein [Hyphomicrobiales bacterium]